MSKELEIEQESEPRNSLDLADMEMVNLTMALRGLGANRMRAFLTMLGVIIGVGAVIVAVGIGQGSGPVQEVL